MKHKVAVAMSGGVDSSVTALLLKQNGYEVVGITFKIWKCKSEEMSYKTKTCCSEKDVADAKNVCSKIGIPHYTFDFYNEFEKYVINPFCESYMKGLTPNPCILCNKHIKFDLLYKKIKTLGFDYLATGHYARIEKKGVNYYLKKGKDPRNEQSYWLYILDQNILCRLLMPLGNYTKTEVRDIAKNSGLPVADKPKSQEICFISEKNYRNFIQKNFNRNELEKGPIVDTKNNVLGYHSGIFNYTIGQREGLGISLGKRIYVAKILPEKNTIVVDEEKNIYSKEIFIRDTNWINKDLKFPLRAKVRIRYKHEESLATIYKINKNFYKIIFDKPQWAPTPGQSAVIYKGDIVLGGGIIQKNDYNN